MTHQTTITPDPDGNGFILHLPEITHLDTQVWSADVGLTAEGLAALRTALAAVSAAVAPPTLAVAEAALAAVETALCDTLLPDAREEALAGIAALLPETADRAAVRAQAFGEAADMLAKLDPVEAALAGEHAWKDAAGLVRHMARQARRMADETATETPHTCKPGASTYHCPTSGQTESDCHGGFTTCCDRPDLHQPAAGARQDGAQS